MTPSETIVKVLTDRLQSVRDVIQFSRRAIKHNPNDFGAMDDLSEYETREQELKQALRYIRAEQQIDQIIKDSFADRDGNTKPIILVSKRLRDIADACEAGGHKSRARMFRAVAKEMEDQFL